jgi:hypothetical protein
MGWLKQFIEMTPHGKACHLDPPSSANSIDVDKMTLINK